MSRGNFRIAPTAHYTAQVWVQAGFPGAGRFDTLTGRVMYWALRSAIGSAGLFAPAAVRHFEDFLVARHRGHEACLRQYDPGFVLEIAAGLSPRGLVLAQELTEILYVEADLSHMVAAKRALLRGVTMPPNYHLRSLDILAPEPWELPVPPPGSTRTLVITEGLIDYLSVRDKGIAWRNVSRFLRSRGGGRYLVEMYTADRLHGLGLIKDGFIYALGKLVGAGLADTFFEDTDAGLQALRECGFDEVAVVDLHSVGVLSDGIPRGANPWVLIEADVLGQAA